jgi:dTDP-4-dehydrorhamnose reductase
MKVIVTGASGQLGRAIVAATPAAVEMVEMPHAALDIADEPAVARAMARHRPDLIINAAAYTAVDRAEGEAAAAMRANRDGPGVLAGAAATAGARLVHLSSDYVFDGTASRPYAPDAPTAPLSVYGRSKAAGEAAVRQSLPDALIVRTAWLYAAHGPNFVRRMIELLGSRDRIGVVADQLGTPTHAASLAGALWALVGAEARGLHHYTDAGVASWYDFAVAIREEALAIGLLEQAGDIVPIRTEDYPTAARRPAYGVLDKTATYALLEKPAPHWRCALRSMLTGLSDG